MKVKLLSRSLTKKQWLNISILFLLGILVQIVNVKTKLNFLGVQKEIQEGDSSKWKAYLIFLLILELFSLAENVHQKFYKSKIKQYVQNNILNYYQSYGRGHERGIVLLMNIITEELLMPLCLFEVLIGLYNIRKNIEMITNILNFQNILIAIVIFSVAMLCGACRGKVDCVKEELEAKNSVEKNDLLKFSVFSKFYLETMLKVMNHEYGTISKLVAKREFLKYFPNLIKQILYVILVWGLVDTVSGTSLYSESYLILTVYGTVLNVSELLGRIVSKLTEIIKMSKNSCVRELISREAIKNARLIRNKSAVRFESDQICITPNFNLSISVAEKKLDFLIEKEIVIHNQEHVFINGAKKSGKTRFFNTILEMFPEYTIMYHTNGKIFYEFINNFPTNENLDVILIKELATGLKLQDFENISKEKFLQLQIKEINTADKNLLSILLILYYAEKRPSSAKLIILDELFANIDRNNAEEILDFIMYKIKKIGATVFFAGHNQQDIIKKYCKYEISLEREGDFIKVLQKQLTRKEENSK